MNHSETDEASSDIAPVIGKLAPKSRSVSVLGADGTVGLRRTEYVRSRSGRSREILDQRSWWQTFTSS